MLTSIYQLFLIVGERLMSKHKGLAALLAVAFLLTGCSGRPATEQIPPEETGTAPVRAQDDFYRYVNGETLASAEFEYAGGSNIDTLDSSAVIEEVHRMIEEIAAGSGYQVGTEEYIIQHLFNSYVEYDFENAGVPEELDQLFHEIDEVATIEEFLLLDARISSEYDIPNTLNLKVGVNYHGQYDAVLQFELVREIIDADLGGLSESYDTLDSIRDKASRYIQAIGYEEEEADNIGTELAYNALDLYNAVGAQQFQDYQAPYFQLYTREQVDEILTNVDLDSYITALNIDLQYADEFGVYNEAQLQALNDMLIEENLPALKAWAIGRLMYAYSDFVYFGYAPLHEWATPNYQDIEENADYEIIKNFGMLLDPIYVERYYDYETDDELRGMIEDIRNQYSILINQATWLTEETRQGLLVKLYDMMVVTGMDVERIDPERTMSLDYTNYFTLYRSIHTLIRKTNDEQLEAPLNRRFLGMRMFEVNACYIPNLNAINITVASASEPFFSVDQDYYVNLGMLGAIVGHEMGHAFDSNCILYDFAGVYNPDWLAPEDLDALNARNEQAIRYFEDNFVVFGIYHVDGAQTLGENYADLGGLESIVNIPETNEQRQIMFEAYARSWCSKIVDEVLINQIADDVHSPDFIRVNALLSTLDAFYETYDVQEGDGMYIPPENRISRWY